jgi:DNA-binding response OmpR family regulator
MKETTVLIVDDERDLREALAFDFRRKGFRALVAASGSEGLSLLATDVVDIVLTDKNMPGLSGPEFITKIRETGSAVPIILFVSDGSLAEAEAIRLGASAVFSKPFALRELREAVKKLCEPRVTSSAGSGA